MRIVWNAIVRSMASHIRCSTAAPRTVLRRGAVHRPRSSIEAEGLSPIAIAAIATGVEPAFAGSSLRSLPSDPVIVYTVV